MNPKLIMSDPKMHITSFLHWAAQQLFHITGIHPSELSAQGLCSGGAMALLCA